MVIEAPVQRRAPRTTTQRVVLQSMTWETYQSLLADLGNQRSSRLAYDHGVLDIAMSCDLHETVIVSQSQL